jgi:hypothetical protein
MSSSTDTKTTIYTVKTEYENFEKQVSDFMRPIKENYDNCNRTLTDEQIAGYKTQIDNYINPFRTKPMGN